MKPKGTEGGGMQRPATSGGYMRKGAGQSRGPASRESIVEVRGIGNIEPREKTRMKPAVPSRAECRQSTPTRPQTQQDYIRQNALATIRPQSATPQRPSAARLPHAAHLHLRVHLPAERARAHTRTQVHPTIFDDPRFLSSKAVVRPQKKTIARPESPLVFSIGRSLQRGTLIPFKQGGGVTRCVASRSRAVRSSSYMYVEYVIPEELLY